MNLSKNISKNIIPLILLAILIAYSLDDGTGSRKWGFLKKAVKKVGHAVGAGAKALWENSPIKQAYNAIRDPKKFARSFVRGVKNVGKDIRNYGVEMGRAGNSLVHGDLEGVYDHWESAVNPIARRGLDFVSGGSASAFERAAGVDLLDVKGQAERFGRGIGQTVSDISRGDYRSGLHDVFDIASPYIQAAEDYETGGMAHQVNETFGDNVTTDPFAASRVGEQLYHGDQATWDHAGEVAGQYAADRLTGAYGDWRNKRVDGLAKYDKRRRR